MQYELPKTTPDFAKLPLFVQGYLKAVFWTDASPDAEEELRDAGYSDLAHDSLAAVIKECEQFQEKAKDLLSLAYEREYNDESAGHDFWLTRNHHGAGFWDRTRPKGGNLGDKLTKIAHSFGESCLLLGDDGKVYVE